MGKKLLIIIILLVILIAGIFFYKQRFNYWPWQINLERQGQREEQKTNTAVNWLIRKIEKVDREQVMEYVSKNISAISPEKPVLGGSWYTTRFWFVFGSDKDFYVEYEDGHIMRKMLIKIEDGKYKVVGFFEPGEDDWQLKSGEDLQFGKPLELYEYDQDLNKWVRKN